MKILFLPLDERPCNLKYPSLMPIEEGVSFAFPDKSLLSLKKKVCDLKPLHDWIKQEAIDADYFIVSMDTLLYGGIVPSRLHHDSLETLIQRSNILKEIKEINPNIKIFANELIMRTPSYSLSDEEPDYFDICGRELWQYGVYLDLEERGLIKEEEIVEFNKLKETLNPQYLSDLMNRREINKQAIYNTLNLYKDGVIDYLIIPQDDCFPFGFTSRDRKDIFAYIKQINLEKELIMHPGADEAGLTLLARVLNDYHKTSLKTYVIYTSELGRGAIPCFEDRGVEITIASHIKACGLTLTDDYENSDIVLFVNNWDYFTGSSKEEVLKINEGRDLSEFINKLIKAINDNKIVGIADNILCNSGDEKLFLKLFENELFKSIHSYAGWNTSSNTLDTTICGLVAYYFSKDDYKKNYFLLHRYVEDFFYMGSVRGEVINKINNNPKWNIKINDLKNLKSPLEQFAKERLERLIYKYQLNILYPFLKISIDFVWNRTFEIDLIIE